MPLDTSIPMQIAQVPQTQALNPMSLYQMMQERQAGALRNQLVQQEMLKNAMIMQNTEEDRRIAAAARAQAAQKAAEDRRRLGEYRDIVGNFGVTPAVVGQRGAGYSGTGLSTDPYESVRNQLVRGGFVPQAEEIAKLQKEQLAGEESKAKIPGLKAVSDKQITEAADAQLKQFQTGIERALTPEAVDMLIKANPAAIAVAGSTPEKSINMFRQRVAEVGFDRARMEVSQGVMAVQKHLSDMATAQSGRSETITGADGNTYVLDKATKTAVPVTVGAVGAPATGAPIAGELLKTTPKGSLSEAQKARLKGETADDFNAASESLRYIQDIERNVDSLKDLNIGGATGYQSLLPSFKEDTIRAENTMKDLTGQLTALGRALASTSGKLGNLAVQEYEFLRQQVAAFDPYAGEKDVRRQLDKIKTSMSRLSNTVRDRYSRAYGAEDNPFPQFRELPKEVGATAPAGASAASTANPFQGFKVEKIGD